MTVFEQILDKCNVNKMISPKLKQVYTQIIAEILNEKIFALDSFEGLEDEFFIDYTVNRFFELYPSIKKIQ